MTLPNAIKPTTGPKKWPRRARLAKVAASASGYSPARLSVKGGRDLQNAFFRRDGRGPLRWARAGWNAAWRAPVVSRAPQMGQCIFEKRRKHAAPKARCPGRTLLREHAAPRARCFESPLLRKHAATKASYSESTLRRKQSALRKPLADPRRSRNFAALRTSTLSEPRRSRNCAARGTSQLSDPRTLGTS